MKERKEYWMEPDVRAVRGVYDEGRTEDGLVHLVEIQPGEVVITREELRAAFEKFGIVLKKQLERELFGEQKGGG